ncbi:MAG: hypothetical protein PHQ23_07745 [Candidatus Wallbacteria bacterium]|nr:hypothetical protein [Candidatus Wallbacteria bacterium]
MAELIDSYTVSPAIVELTGPGSMTGLVTIANDTEITYRMQVNCVFFPPEKLFLGERLTTEITIVEDISDLVVLSPRIMKLSPVSRRSLRFSVKSDPRFSQPGEFRANLVFTPVVEFNNSPDQTQLGSVVTSIDWVVEMRVPIYLAIGKRAEAQLEITGKIAGTEDEPELNLVAVNTTSWRYPAQFEVSDRNGELIKIRRVFLRQTKKDFSVPLPRLPSGTITIKWSSYLDYIPGTPGQLSIQPL